MTFSRISLEDNRRSYGADMGQWCLLTQLAIRCGYSESETRYRGVK